MTMVSQGLPPSSNLLNNNEELKSIIISIIEKCKSEAKYKKLHIPLEEYEYRASYYTGIPIECIKDISNKIQSTDTESHSISLGLSKRILIYDTLQRFYAKGETPALEDLHIVLNQITNFPELFVFKDLMTEMGFNYRKLENGKIILIEDPKLTFERCLYLNKIKKIRNSSSQIYYIDERIIDDQFSFTKPYLQNNNKLLESGNQYIFYHTFTHDGEDYVVDGLFSNQGAESDFQKWVVDILINTLKPSSTIIMDKTPMHGVLKDTTISKYHPKEKMLQWLKENDVPCTAEMSKAQLYELIRKLPSTDEEFAIDRILKAHGHTVLRLPTHLHELSPTEFMWEYLSTCDFTSFNPEVESIQSKILAHIKNIPTDIWISFVKSTEKYEDNLMHTNAETEKSLENYTFSFR